MRKTASKRAGIIVESRRADEYTLHFREFRDPLNLLSSFVAHVHQGINPPGDILQAVSAAIERVLEGKEEGLDEALGLKRKGKGAWNAITVATRKGTQAVLCTFMLHLTKGCGLSEEQAAERLSFFLESQDDMYRYTADGLLQLYRRTWKKPLTATPYSTILSKEHLAILLLLVFPSPDASL
jgi:hypothetical protein